jgi:hypothetical protein
MYLTSCLLWENGTNGLSVFALHVLDVKQMKEGSCVLLLTKEKSLNFEEQQLKNFHFRAKS